MLQPKPNWSFYITAPDTGREQGREVWLSPDIAHPLPPGRAFRNYVSQTSPKFQLWAASDKSFRFGVCETWVELLKWFFWANSLKATLDKKQLKTELRSSVSSSETVWNSRPTHGWCVAPRKTNCLSMTACDTLAARTVSHSRLTTGFLEWLLQGWSLLQDQRAARTPEPRNEHTV